MAKVELKQPIVQAISESIKGAQSVVLVDHRGLTVAQDTVLRKQFREAGIEYKVRKNRMMNLAFEGTEFDELRKVLDGPSAMAVSKDDPTAPARIIANFAKTAPILEFKAGIVDGVFYDAEGMKQIASIPGREELLSRLLGSMQSPVTNFARVLKQIAEQDGEAAPAEAAPAEEAPTEEAPVAEAPAEETAPAEEAPAEEAPAE